MKVGIKQKVKINLVLIIRNKFYPIFFFLQKNIVFLQTRKQRVLRLSISVSIKN